MRVGFMRPMPHSQTYRPAQRMDIDPRPTPTTDAAMSARRTLTRHGAEDLLPMLGLDS